ncbi:hypothetical protein OsI_35180 [Oryza sativa Indica Group]|uniref:RNase H type-1 domain-containing protein n=1 Tax=Oryza sativa subsp. indica TaxID=39946 RepID=B8BJ69_ORYSI|nr:hypothetical protein OsI_35180 [Oryza sativa Indica Group]
MALDLLVVVALEALAAHAAEVHVRRQDLVLLDPDHLVGALQRDVLTVGVGALVDVAAIVLAVRVVAAAAVLGDGDELHDASVAVRQSAGRGLGNGGHCFFKFKLVKNCWRLMNLEQTRLSLKMLDSGRSVVEHILNLEEGRRLQIACLMWCWWDTRNKVNAGEQGSSSTEIVRRANFMASAPAGLMSVRTPSPEGVSAGRSVWKFPHEDELKLNVDGAFYEASNSGGWGFILRNPFALQAAAEWGVSQVEVETDSKVLVTAVQSSSYDQAPGGVPMNWPNGVLVGTRVNPPLLDFVNRLVARDITEPIV